MVDDVVVGGEDAVRQPVVAHELPDVFHRVELGALRRQGDDADVVRHGELAGHMPACLIHQHGSMGTRGDHQRYLGKVQRHCFGIADGQDQPGALSFLRADRPEDVGRPGALILRSRRPRTAPGPAPRDLVFLTDAGLVLEPDLYGRARREACLDLCQIGREAPFLNASSACSFCA